MNPLLVLLIQIGVVLLAARVVGWLFRKIQQPQVMGEMVAGILLGPSVLGWFAPNVSAQIFPPQSLPALNALSQTGLLVFMFLVGLELNPKHLRGRGHAALVTSHASIIAPFLLGALLALRLYPRYSDDGVPFAQFALFMGAAMSITAFPVLARILTERNLLSTRVGAVTIACAAIDDVTAWCILAGVIAFVRTSAGGGLLLTFGGSALYALFMIFVARRALRGLEAYYHNRGRLTRDAVALVLLLVLASAWVTEWIGIHALFGAFLVGAVMPKDKGFVHDLTTRLMDFTLVLLLPLFFAFTGLRTRIGLLDDPSLWGDCAIVSLVAVAGKLGGSSLAARLSGLSWREAGALGVLMNTRGLMELVILTIGLDLGVISPTVFVMMVIMALATTFMTTPVLEWIYPARLMRKATIPMESSEGPRKYTVLIPIALPSSGPALFEIAKTLAPAPRLCVYGLHLSRPDDFQMTNLDSGPGPADVEALRPFVACANQAKVEVRPLAFMSRSFGEDVAEVAFAKGVDLIVLGWHKPVINQSVLGGTVYDVISHAKVDVAVSIPRKSNPWRRVLLPYSGGFHDDLALKLGDRIARHSELELVILHVVKKGAPVRDPLAGLSEQARASGRVSVRQVESDDAEEVAITEARAGYDLVIIGASEEWGLEPHLLGMWHERLAMSCPASMLIVRRQRPPESGDGLARTAAMAGKDV